MTHIALLRGINVGGQNRLSMADLVRLFDEAGAERVRTYIQSGNVVFDAPANRAGRVATTVSSAIASQIGLEVPIVTRTATDLSRIVGASPFAKTGDDPTLLHVGFLAGRPAAAASAALDPDRSPPDECVLQGRELYLHCPNGMARTKFTNAYLDRTLGTVTTIRNWRTTLKLLEMVGE
ncbi:MAG: DUF1697 domain-containing protein [Vicinamibacterales bacterium]|nr:DUF1697 domain-containing protein [Vicinamibacterales bacterium]MDP7480499.1 DUF1697 domain-containing protein [Vicinamibacterales bacterium]MDP7692133.1 DUF1697 domain-containing protein [Vicinamibacterales bacterium]HJN45881.1 DUF1697 domain-containing protein [Vicinamibacterales bacterium]